MGGSLKIAARMSTPDHPGIAGGRQGCLHRRMEIRNRDDQSPFTTKDGSTIRSLLDLSNAPVASQSLAEASLPPGCATERHYHRLSEEFYYLLEGCGMMEIDGEKRPIGPGDAVLIPAGAWHQVTAIEPLRFLCCCAPPYSHDDTFFE
jgi:mannose-6-phosphate isomerase-like protein (cupin superfamily)